MDRRIDNAFEGGGEGEGGREGMEGETNSRSRDWKTLDIVDTRKTARIFRTKIAKNDCDRTENKWEGEEGGGAGEIEGGRWDKKRIKEKDDKRRGKYKSEKSVSPFDLYENYHVINTYWSFIIVVIITDDYYDYYGLL